MRTILTVIGTRPQYIKYAALASALREKFRVVLADTGQHYSDGLSRLFQEEYALPRPDHLLGTTPSGGLPRLSTYLGRLDSIITEDRPDALLCFGDTDSALAAALAGVKLGVPVMHVEAGERSHRADGSRVRAADIPEEINRVIIDHSAALLLCATVQGQDNCLAEHCSGTAVHTGDITYDLFLNSHAVASSNADELARYEIEPARYYFATIHRPINTDDRERLAMLLETLNSLDAPVLLPLHPRTASRMNTFGIIPADGALRRIDPLSHHATIALARSARRVLTDSGGLTREAYFCGIPSICLDDSTAWHELTRLGWCTITGADGPAIHEALGRDIPPDRPALFGDGHAAEAVIDAITRFTA